MADEDKLINVIIKYLTEGGAEAKSTQEELDKTLAKGYSALQEHFKGNSAALKQWVGENKTALNALGVELENTEKKYRSMRMAARELGQIGTAFTLAGGLLTAGLVADANNYVKTVGVINTDAAKWLGYQEQIKNANLQIGQTATTAILPAMKSAADFMQTIASIAQANPWLIQGALAAGGVMLAIGATTKIIAEIMRVIADIGLLMGKLGLAKAGEAGAAGAGGLGATLGTVTLIATSVIIGAELGLALGNYLGKLIYGESYKTQNLQDAYMTLVKIFQLPWLVLAQQIQRLDPALAGAAGKFGEFINTLDEKVGSFIGASQYKSADGPSDMGTDQKAMITQQEVQAFIDYNKQLNAAQENYSAQRKDIIANYEQQVIDVTQQYEQQRADIIANYNQAEAKAAENFQRQQANAAATYKDQVAKAERSFQIQQQRSAQQHAIDMQRLEDQHNNRMRDLAGQRDALGLVKEQQNYLLQRSQKEQDYRIQEQQRRQDLQLQLSDMRESFNRQRAEAQAAYAQQSADRLQQEQEALATMDAQHKLEMAKMDKAEQDKLAKLDAAYKKEVDMIQTAFVDRLRALDSAILGDTAAFNSYMQNEAQQFQQWLNNYKSQVSSAIGGVTGGASIVGGGAKIGTVSTTRTGVTAGTNYGGGTVRYPGTGYTVSRQYGGYMSFAGPGETGRPEFVMSGPSTHLAEQIIGSRLNQANLLSTIMAARGGALNAGAQGLHITVQSRTLTVSEIRREVNNALHQSIGDLLPAFGAA